MSTKGQELIVPEEIEMELSMYDIFQKEEDTIPQNPTYEYMRNKVYHIRPPQDLTDKIRELANNQRVFPFNKFLAGDLKHEFGLKIKGKVREEFDSFWYFVFERMFGQKILDIKFDGVYSKETKDDVITDEEQDDIWVNYMQRYEHNPLHNHAGIFSFVWYLHIPEQIRQEHIHQKENSNARSRGLIEFVGIGGNPDEHPIMRFNPRQGDVLIFPSAQLHQVYPFYTDNIRVSMAGNIKLLTIDDGSEDNVVAVR